MDIAYQKHEELKALQSPTSSSDAIKGAGGTVVKFQVDSQRMSFKYDRNNFFHKHVLTKKKPKSSNEDSPAGRVLRAILHHKTTLFLNGLLMLDLIILIVSMQLELYYFQSKIDEYDHACSEGLPLHGNLNLHHWEEYLQWVSVGILGIFVLENVGLIYGMGWEFWTSPMEVLDLVVVGLSLYFELAKETFAASVLLVSRTWRFVRFMHGMIELEHDTHHVAQKNTLAEAEAQAEDENADDRLRVTNSIQRPPKIIE